MTRIRQDIPPKGSDISMKQQRSAIDLPLGLWLIAAFASFVTSVIVWFLIDKETGLFVGIWVPSILSLAAALRAGK